MNTGPFVNVEPEETTRLWDVRLVALVIPKVLIPETTRLWDVRLVADVIPKVLIPLTTRLPILTVSAVVSPTLPVLQ